MQLAVESDFFTLEAGKTLVYNDRVLTPGLELSWCPFCRASLNHFEVGQQVVELKTNLQGVVEDVYDDFTYRIRTPYGWKVVKRDDIDGN